MLKTILEELQNEAGATFPETAKLPKADFAKWKETQGKRMKVTYGKEGDMILIYSKFSGKETHVASYDTKKEEIHGTNLSFIKGMKS